MNRLRKGDDVIVIAGRSKGQRGQVLRIRKDGKLMVENVNMVKRHTKPDPNRGIRGGILEKESPIHASNVMIYNAATNQGDRVGYRTLEDGKKVRFFRSTGEVIDS